MKMLKAAHFVVLVALGFAGNYFDVPLYLGVSFLFGSAAALIALQALGILAGAAVAAIAGTYTLVLWGHPWAAVIFVLEVVVVGLLRRRRRHSLVLLDGVFWLAIGIPLDWCLYSWFLRLETETVLLIAMKQAVNGVFNALLASAVIACLPFYRRLRALESVRSSLATSMVALVLLPGLVVMILDGRRLMHQLESQVEFRIRDTSADIGTHVQDWLDGQLDTVCALASLAAESPSLQHDVALVKRTAPGVLSLFVADSLGTATAFWPPTNERGEPTVGLNFADREYFRRAKSTLRPVVSNVILGRGSSFVPLVTVSAPILVGGKFQGLVSGALDLDYLAYLLATHNASYGSLAVSADITLVDAHDVVVASTVDERPPLTLLRRGGGNGLSRWAPDTPGLADVARWQRSLFVYESDLGTEHGWRLIVEAPFAPLQKALYRGYLGSLAVLAGLLGLTLVLSAVFSRQMARPLNELADLTADLPAKLLAGRNLAWPTSSATELHRLVVNYRGMAQSLQATLQSLNHRTAQLGTIFDSITDPTFVLGDDALVLRANDAFCRLVKRTAREVPGQPLDNLLPGFAAACGTRLHTDLRRSAETTRAEWHDPAGVVHLVHYFPIETADGRESAVVRLQDVTGDRELEHRLLQSEKLASIGQLAAGVAHEINNPMAFIVSNLNRLDEYASELSGVQGTAEFDFLVEDTRAIIRESQEGAERIRKIVLDLKAFSHANSQDCQFTDLNQGLESTLNIIWNELKYRCAVVKDYGELPQVYCRPQRINQVFMNLLMNAAQAIPEQGTVTIRTRAEGEQVLVSITDTGIGIPPENLSRIFEPFFTTKPVGKGTGLGLHISYGIIRRHHGEIRVESEPGRGTTFTVVLPIAVTEPLLDEQDLLQVH